MYACMHVFADYVTCKWRHSPFVTLIIIIKSGTKRYGRFVQLEWFSSEQIKANCI